MKIYILILIIGIILLMNGYHSIDLAYNSENISYDKTLTGIIIDIQTVYSNGWKQIFISIPLIIFSSYNIGLYYFYLQKRNI